MGILERHNVNITGKGSETIIFVHGYGCDQNMWRFVAPEFTEKYKVVLLDLMGAGKSDTSDYNHTRYGSLQAHAEDIVAIARELNLKDAMFVGHSVSAMIGVLAAKIDPSLFCKLVLVGPSPRYINDVGYVGGFEQADIEDLLESLSNNYLGWSNTMAPAIMGNPDRPELSQELANSFCQMDPEIAKNFARATFLSDNRSDLAEVKAEALILQCSEDIIAPLAVGKYVHCMIPKSRLVIMKATGHCPNLSAPEETTEAIKSFLGNNLCA